MLQAGEADDRGVRRTDQFPSEETWSLRSVRGRMPGSGVISQAFFPFAGRLAAVVYGSERVGKERGDSGHRR